MSARREQLRVLCRRLVVWLEARLSLTFAWLGKHGPVPATIGLGLFGWFMLTDVLASWLGASVWRVSVGLLAFSLFGWRFAFTIARDGLYSLSQRGKKP